MTRNHRHMEIPATLVHTKGGKRYKVNGTLVAINESAGTCSMKFNGHPVQKGIPMSKVYINEGVIDDIKDLGKKVFNKLVSLVKTAAGFILPKYEDGTVDMNAMASPVNQCIVQDKLGADSPINVVLPDSTIDYYKSIGIELSKNEPGFAGGPNAADDISDEYEAANKYWSAVIKEYGTNESYTLDDAFRAVNEKYCDYQKGLKPVNEAAVASLYDYSGGYGNNVTREDLMEAINSYLDAFYEGTLKDSDKPNGIMIWGAPGIGKTAIISKVLKEYKSRMYDLAYTFMSCSGFNSDNAFLPSLNRGNDGEIHVDAERLSKTKAYRDAQDELKHKKGYGGAEKELDDLAKMNMDYGFSELADEMDFTNNVGVSRGNTIETAVKALLPIYNVESGANAEEINRERDEFINSGKFLKESNTFFGGILFIDEFSRLPAISRNTMMAIVNERQDGDWRLGSKWAIIGSANRYYDMGIEETDTGMGNALNAAGQKFAAETQRWQNYNYVPSVEEWLEWAKGKSTYLLPKLAGQHKATKFRRQNVDDFIIRFIETSDNPTAMLYKAVITPPSTTDSTSLGFTGNNLGAYDDQLESDDIAMLHDYCKHVKMSRDEWNELYRIIGEINDANTYSPRTYSKNVWPQMYASISAVLLGPVHKQTVERQKLFLSAFDGNGNVNFTRLAKALDQVDYKTWEEFVASRFGNNWKSKLLKGRGDVTELPRIDVMLRIFRDVMNGVMGKNSNVADKFDTYLEYGTSMTSESYYNVWKHGSLVEPNERGNELDKADSAAMRSSAFNKNPLMRWKSLDAVTKGYFETMLQNFPQGVDKFRNMLLSYVNELIRHVNPEFASPKIPAQKTAFNPNISDAEINNIKGLGEITINAQHFDKSGTKMDKEKTVKINVFDYISVSDTTTDKSWSKNIYVILRTSLLARSVFNFAKYWLKVSLERQSDSYITSLAKELDALSKKEVNALSSLNGIDFCGNVGIDAKVMVSLLSGTGCLNDSAKFKSLKQADRMAAMQEIGKQLTAYSPFIPAAMVANMYSKIIDAKLFDGKSLPNFVNE